MTPLETQLLEYVGREAYEPLRPKDLAKKLGLRKKELGELQSVIEMLSAQKRIRVSSKGRVQPVAQAGTIVGILRKTSAGDGYVIPHSPAQPGPDNDIFVDRRDLKDAQQGDEVLVRLSKKRRARGGRIGYVVDILERATTVFVGRYFEEQDAGFVLIDGRDFSEPIWVGDPGAKGASEGDMVVIEMLRFPSHSQRGEAVLTKVLGPRGEVGVDTQTVIHEFGIPQEFSEDALEQARQAAETFRDDDLDGREDLTKEIVVTIDPVDARDFDDAISLKRTDDGHWHLGVHIADVSHFVVPGTVLDQEAEQRGNSVYLPNYVIPMLPEVISNGLASLQEGRRRFTKSAFIEFDPDGVPLHTRLANTVILVTQRFAYEEVLPLVHSHPRASRKHGDVEASPEVVELLKEMHALSRILRNRRLRRGALELALPEVKLDIDKEGKVTGAHEAVHDESHQLIEEFMLAANVAVAKLLTERNIEFLRRVHGSPALMKQQQFREFVDSLGLPLKNPQSRQELQKLLTMVQGTPLEHAVHYACLRSMKQAIYSTQHEGHYALAEEHYCHFTSPIRRYPDLVVHRIVDDVILRPDSATPITMEVLTRLGIHCSSTERRAESAERELISLKLLQFLEDQIGLEIPVVITGVERFGIFCHGIELPVDGLVHISSLPYDRYDYDQSRLALVGRRGDNLFQLGQRLIVGLASVDLDRRQVDLRFVKRIAGGESLPKRNTGGKKRKRRDQEAPSKGKRGAKNKRKRK